MSQNRTISALYSTYDAAAETIAQLERLGYDKNNLTIVTNHPGLHNSVTDIPEHTADTNKEEFQMAREQGEVGLAFGAGAGLLAGLGALLIPGLGPVMAVGWLTATFMGATLGGAAGLTSALVEAGALDKHAEAYVNAVKNGGTLVVVKTADDKIDEVEVILQRLASPELPLEKV